MSILLHSDAHGWLESWCQAFNGPVPVLPTWADRRERAYRFADMRSARELKLPGVAYLEEREP